MTCSHPDCESYPYYGGAPGRDAIIRTADGLAFAQLSTTDPRETWPANFVEDPECPGLGAWYCPGCVDGRSE